MKAAVGLLIMAAGSACGAISWAVRPSPNYVSVAFFAVATLTLLVLARLVHREA